MFKLPEGYSQEPFDDPEATGCRLLASPPYLLRSGQA